MRELVKSTCMFLLLILFFTIPSGKTEAQETGIEFTKVIEEAGIKNGSIVCIFQDSEGFLWLGTYGGLFRYDGNNFKLFLPVKNNPNSLINGHVRSICQDSTGAIFIGTIGGLCIYDPKTEQFSRFIHDPENPNSLSNNTIYKLYKDRTGTIWAGTWGGGLEKIEKMNGQENLPQPAIRYKFIHHVPNKVSNSISSLNIIDIAETPDGKLWLATLNGLCCYDKKTGSFKNYHYHPEDPHSLSNNNVSSVCVDQSGHVWAGTWEYGLNLLEGDGKKFTRFIHNPSDKNSLGHNIIMKLYCDRSGTIWVGTWGGGLDKIEVQDKISDTSGRHYRFVHFSNDKSNPGSISGNSIYSILEDKTGTMWIGTDWKGLNKFTTNTSQFKQVKSIPGEENSLVDNVVFSLLLDNPNHLWIGTQKGISIYDNKTGKFALYQNNPADPHSLSHNEVRSLIKDHMGTIWVGTVQGLNRFDPKRKQFERYLTNPSWPGPAQIINLYEDNKGYIWLGTYDQGLVKFDPRNGSYKKYVHNPKDRESISSNIIWAIVQDRNSKIWVGTEQGGLCEFDPVTEKFTTYMNNPDDPHSLSHNTVYSLKTDDRNNLWIATVGGFSKLSLSNREKGFANYIHKLVNGIAEDNRHEFWLNTNIGLCRFNPADSSVKYYTSGKSTRQGLKFSMNAILYDTLMKEVYVGGFDGYSIFDPKISEKSSLPPVTNIVNLKIFNKTVNIGEKINGRVVLSQSITSLKKLAFSHKEYVISFEFSAMHFQSPGDNQYAYILEGFDKEWSFVGNQRIATYTSLPPGRYTFRVKAANPDGVWNDDNPTAIEIVIQPAWWNTLVFRIFLILALISLVISAFYIRFRIMKERQRLLEHTVSKRTEELSYANALLQEKQEEITLQNEELVRHRNDLKKLVDERTHELTLAKNRAEESDRLKSAFLANMSHEIRTPLNAIVGFSSMLNDENLEQDEKESFIDTIRNSSERLLTLINDILDISMIDTNQMPLFNERFCVNELLEELKGFYYFKDYKALRMECLNDGDQQKTYLFTDPRRLQQVLINLLSNAHKFTESGYIRFGFKKDDKVIRFVVEDSGVGISAEDQARIFEDFLKIEPTPDKFHQGAGIGLSISKRLVEKMGGTFFVSSMPNQGSVFSFTLPYHDDQPDQTGSDSAADDQSHGGKTVVVAEDEPDNYRLIERLLKKTGAPVFWAHNGQEAVDYVKQHGGKNCLVLMDIKMPVMDGYEACRLIRELDKNIPIIAVTAYAQSQDKKEILSRGFDGFIPKPLNFNKVLEILEQYQIKARP